MRNALGITRADDRVVYITPQHAYLCSLEMKQVLLSLIAYILAGGVASADTKTFRLSLHTGSV